LLALSNLFFLGEIVFACSMRLLSDRRRLIAFIVVIALLHVGVLERGLPQAIPNAELNYWLLIATVGVMTISTLIRLGLAYWRAATGLSVERRRQLARMWYSLRIAPNCALISPQTTWRFTPPRAPPALYC
jgi:hypothetical protein